MNLSQNRVPQIPLMYHHFPYYIAMWTVYHCISNFQSNPSYEHATLTKSFLSDPYFHHVAAPNPATPHPSAFQRVVGPHSNRNDLPEMVLATQNGRPVIEPHNW